MMWWRKQEKLEKWLGKLQAKEKSVRLRAIKKLGRLGDAQVVQPLVNMLTDPDPVVRQHVVTTLEKIGWSPKNATEHAYAAIAQRKWEEVISLGNAAIEPLIREFETGGRDVQEKVIEILAEIGDSRSAELLVKEFEEQRSLLRQKAQAAVEKIGSVAVEPLITVVGSEDSGGRVKATRILGEIGDVRAVEPLIKNLRDEDEYVRSEAVVALGKLGDSRAIEPLIQAIRDPDANVRQGAAMALGKLGDVRAINPLITALGDVNLYVQQAATNALLQIGVPAVGALINALEKSDRNVRRSIIEVLKNIGDVRAVDALNKALQDVDEHVRQSAVGALGQLGDARAVPPLVKTLGDPNLYVRQAAIKALLQIGAPAVDPLGEVLAHPDQHVRHGAIEVLRNINEIKAVDVLSRALTNPDTFVRENVAVILGRIGDPRSVEPLIERLLKEQSPGVRWGVKTALKEIGAPAINPLTNILQLAGKEDREQIIELLHRIGVSTEVVVFGDHLPDVVNQRTTLQNPEAADYTFRMPHLKRIIVYADTYDFDHIERFLTYAVNYIGQEALKKQVEVHIYGNPDNLHLNLYNGLANLCKRVDVHAEQ